MKIRRAMDQEAEELTLLARQAKASWGYPAKWLTAWEEALRFTPSYLRLHAVFVVEVGRQLVGVVAVEATPEPEIAHLWVHPDHHDRGIGRALVTQATQVARANGWRSLRIESDPNAQAFYERLGAVQVGEVNAAVAGDDRSLPLLELPIARAR